MTEQPPNCETDTQSAPTEKQSLPQPTLFDHLCNSLRNILSRQNVASDPKLAQIMRSWAEQQHQSNPSDSVASDVNNEEPKGQGKSTDTPQPAEQQQTPAVLLSDRRQSSSPPPLGIPIAGLLEHPALAGLNIDEEMLYKATETLPANIVKVHRSQGYLEPIMKAERSTIFLRDMPEGTTTEASLRQFLMESPLMQNSSSADVNGHATDHSDTRIQVIRHEPIGNLWFITLASSKLATEMALWLRQQEFNGQPLVVGVKSEAEYQSPLSKSATAAAFNMEGMFVPTAAPMYTPPLSGGGTPSGGGSLFSAMRRGERQCVTGASGWSGSPQHGGSGRHNFHGPRRFNNGQLRSGGYRPNTPPEHGGGSGFSNGRGIGAGDVANEGQHNTNRRSGYRPSGGGQQSSGFNFSGSRGNSRSGQNNNHHHHPRSRFQPTSNRNANHTHNERVDMHSYNSGIAHSTMPPPPAYLKDALEFPPITLAAKFGVNNATGPTAAAIGNVLHQPQQQQQPKQTQSNAGPTVQTTTTTSPTQPDVTATETAA